MPRGRSAEATIFGTTLLPPHYDPHIVFVTLHPTRRHDQPPLEAAAWLHFGNPPQLSPPADLGANHTLVILLAGGTKKRQARDVEDAKQRWDDYKRRKKIEG